MLVQGNKVASNKDVAEEKGQEENKLFDDYQISRIRCSGIAKGFLFKIIPFLYLMNY